MTVANSSMGSLRSWFDRTFVHWRGDLTGGLTAAVVALPLALAFAVASGVEPKAGLYTAIVAGTVAAVFGGSPVQITGPTGAMAVVLIGIVTKYGIEKVWIAGVMAGIIQEAIAVASTNPTNEPGITVGIFVQSSLVTITTVANPTACKFNPSQ